MKRQEFNRAAQGRHDERLEQGLAQLAARQNAAAPALPHGSNHETPLESRARRKREERERQARGFEVDPEMEALERLKTARPDVWDGWPPAGKMALHGYVERRAAAEELARPVTRSSELVEKAEREIDEAEGELTRLRSEGASDEAIAAVRRRKAEAREDFRFALRELDRASAA